jgi:hypothetical protein
VSREHDARVVRLARAVVDAVEMQDVDEATRIDALRQAVTQLRIEARRQRDRRRAPRVNS